MPRAYGFNSTIVGFDGSGTPQEVVPTDVVNPINNMIFVNEHTSPAVISGSSILSAPDVPDGYAENMLIIVPASGTVVMAHEFQVHGGLQMTGPALSSVHYRHGTAPSD